MAAVAVVVLLTILQLAVHGYAILPPPGSVTIGSVTAKGDGCLEGTYECAVSDDGHALTVMYSQFTAVTDQGLSAMRRKCDLNIPLNYPQGFTFTLTDVTLRGYAKLDEGVTGLIQTSYHIVGLAGTGRATLTLSGLFDDNFENGESFVSPAISSCNQVRDLIFNTEVRVVPRKSIPKGNGIVTVDTTDLKLTQIFAFSWETC